MRMMKILQHLNPNSLLLYKLTKKSIYTNEDVSPKMFKDLHLLLGILKYFGIIPFYSQVSPWEIAPPSRRDEYYSRFIRSLIYAYTILNIYFMNQYGLLVSFEKTNDTDNISQWIKVFLCIVAYVSTLFISGRHEKRLLQMFNDILKIDKIIYQQYGVRVKNQCQLSNKTIVLIAICYVYIIYIKTALLGKGTMFLGEFFLFSFYSLQYVICSMFVILIASILKIIFMRFAFINEVLGVQSACRKKFDISEDDNVIEETLFVFKLHNKLINILKLVNTTSSLILIAFMGYSFYTITTDCYNTFIEITTKREISFAFIQLCVAWIIMDFSLLALLAVCCGWVTKEANSTCRILARVYGKSKEMKCVVGSKDSIFSFSNFLFQIDKFLTKSIKLEIEFTAYGFFVIDNSTLFKVRVLIDGCCNLICAQIFSAVTTYLVILIQFKQLEDSKLEEKEKSLEMTPKPNLGFKFD